MGKLTEDSDQPLIGTEKVRYYEVDWKDEKFPSEGRTLREWRDLSHKLNPDELDRLRIEVEAEILRKGKEL